MKSAAFQTSNPKALARLVTIFVVSASMIMGLIPTAEARSRRSNVAIGVGAAIVGAIILNEAIKAEERKKHRRPLSRSERRRSPGSVARQKPDSRQSDRVARKPKPEQETLTKPRDEDGSDVETGALTDTPSAQAASRFKFPIVFYDKILLQRLGVVIGGYGPPETEILPYKSKCYKKTPTETEVTPDELYALSLSDDFVLKFAKRGFTLNSLCLAIASGVRYDPETGRRLPTFILADAPALKENDASSYTNEIPLDVPNCFRFGRPYSNCKFVFDPKTGAKLGSDLTKRYADLGRKIDQHVAKAMAAGKWSKTCADVQMHDGSIERLQDCKMETDREGWLQNDGIISFNLSGKSEDPLTIDETWEKQRMIDVSPVFPEGYGYALYAPTGVGGPAPVEAANRTDAQDTSRVQSEATVPGVLAWLASWF